MRQRVGAREVAALALLAIAVAIAWPFLNPNGGSGEPRPVELGTGTAGPFAAATAPAPVWTIEARTLDGGRTVSSDESPVLDVDWRDRPWALRARSILVLPSPGLWNLVFEHEQPFTVPIDGAAFAIEGGAPGQQASVVFQYAGTPAVVEVTSEAVDGRLRLRLVTILRVP